MKKSIPITLLVFAIIGSVFMWKSSYYHLQDGYYLHGSGNGFLSKGYFERIISRPIVGVQGSKQGYIYGWLTSESKGIDYFLISTASQNIEWFSNLEELNKKCNNLGIEHLDMNKEINLAGLRSGTEHYYLK